MYKIIAIIEILILIFVWPILLVPSIMIFDAPNSTSLIIPWVLAGSLWSYPLFVIVGLGLAFWKRKSNNSIAKKFILLPLIPILILVLMLSVMIFQEWWVAPTRT